MRRFAKGDSEYVTHAGAIPRVTRCTWLRINPRPPLIKVAMLAFSGGMLFGVVLTMVCVRWEEWR